MAAKKLYATTVVNQVEHGYQSNAGERTQNVLIQNTKQKTKEELKKELRSIAPDRAKR